MIVMLVGDAPEIEAQLGNSHVVLTEAHTVKPPTVPTSMVELTPLLGGRSLPDVLILVAGQDPAQTLPLARILPIEQHVGVVIALREPDPTFAIDALRTGASDVISTEPSMEELKSALTRAATVAQRAAQPTQPSQQLNVPLKPAERGTVIAVGSATGGVGKTFAALNLAIGIAGCNPGSTCIVDAVSQFGGVADQLDVLPQFTMPDIVAANDSIAAKTYLTPHSSGLYVAPASENPAALDRTDPAKIAETVEMLAHQFKTVVVDTETGLTPVSLEILARADELLVVSDFTVHSVRATRIYLRYIDMLPRHIPIQTKLMLNRMDPALAIKQRNAEETIGRKADFLLRDDPQIGLAGNLGKPPMLAGHRDKVRRMVSPLVDLFHPHDDPKRAAGKVA